MLKLSCGHRYSASPRRLGILEICIIVTGIMSRPPSDERGKFPVFRLVDNGVNRASSRSSSTADQCAFFSAIASSRANRRAGSRSYRSSGNGAASYGCQTEHQKSHYRRYYLCFHLLPPLDVVTDPSLTTGR